MAFKIVDTISKRILMPFRLVPEKGISSEKIAFSITIGIISGLFPVIGATTLISLLLTMIFRQNLIIVQSVQWILGLLQLILIIPFMQFGAYLLNQKGLQINMEQINLAFQPGILSGIKAVGIFHLYGILTWVILALPASAASYYAFLAVFQKKSKKL